MFDSHKTRTILVGVFVLCVVIAALFVFNSSSARALLFTFIEPVTKAGIHFSDNTQALVSAGFNFKQQGNENIRLLEENQKLKAELLISKDIQIENDQLRKQIGEGKQKKYTLSLAEIVSYDPFHFAQYALINKGSLDGVSENMPVIMTGNILFGKITKIYPHYSKVMLIADKNNKVSVQAQDSTINGVLSGSNGSVLFMDLLEKNASVDTGTIIITSGLDGIYPKNLFIGSVSEVVSEEEGIFKQAYITPTYSSASQKDVFIIMDYLR